MEDIAISEAISEVVELILPSEVIKKKNIINLLIFVILFQI